MIEKKFTERLKTCIRIADEEASKMGHNYIGTEHIVLAILVNGDGMGASILKGLGVTSEAVKA